MKLVLAFLLVLPQVHAEEFASWNDLRSPWTTPARYWLLGGMALTGVILAFEDQIDDPAQAEFVEDKPIGKLSAIGDYGGQLIPNGIYALGMLAAHWKSADPVSFHHGMIMLKASAYAVSVSTLLKVIVREKRPNSRDRMSFPSGHTTAAFSFASVVVAEHGWFPYGVPAVLLASLTAASRVNDNQHYLHDVVAGATIGTAFGYGVSFANQPVHRSTWILLPVLGETPGFMAAKEF